MAEQNKILPRPIFRRDVTWDPLPLGLPPFLEPSDREWIHWAKRRLDSLSGPGSTQCPPLPPFSGQHTAVLNHKGPRQATSSVSEIQSGQDSWKINLDVNHFSPEEITITTKEGYLLISGNHEEMQDEHGLVSRSFTRKYKLAQGVDLQNISSSLSGDGVLSIEAPAPGTSISSLINDTVIPVQIRQTVKSENRI